jgi:hypothetical protein
MEECYFLVVLYVEDFQAPNHEQPNYLLCFCFLFNDHVNATCQVASAAIVAALCGSPPVCDDTD